MRSIGEMARDSGLSVSALRFYDRAGVLVPDWVDPVSGYRWYGPGQLPEARLLARLRRVGMPLADVRLVLAGWSGADADLVRKLLDAHLRRLERGLTDARRELSAVRALLERRENPMTPVSTATARLTVPADGLAAALDAVRFAVGTDPDLPMLGGVLFDAGGGVLRLVATDRYRMAVAGVEVADHEGDDARATVPAPLADAMRALLDGTGPARLTVDGDRVSLETGGRQAAGPCPGQEFPDYRRLVRLPAGRRVTVDVPALREAVRTGPVRARTPGEDGAVFDVTVLAVTADGAVTVAGEDAGEDGEGRDAPVLETGVNREFLLDALAAGARDRLVMEFGDPTAPVAVRRPDDEGTFSLLMPVRLEG